MTSARAAVHVTNDDLLPQHSCGSARNAHKHQYRKWQVLIGEHRFGLLPSHRQELVVLQSGSWQSSEMPLRCDIPPPEHFLFCLDNTPAGSLAPDVGAFEECSAVSDGAALKASAAACLDVEDSEDSSHHGGLETVVPSMRSSTSAVSGTESPRKGLFKERIYSCGKTILLESQAKYACHLCPYMTKSKAAMISHRRKHKGVLPHKCDICGRGFLHHSTLLYHLRTHTGERPYACSVCPSTFACLNVVCSTGTQQTYTLVADPLSGSAIGEEHAYTLLAEPRLQNAMSTGVETVECSSAVARSCLVGATREDHIKKPAPDCAADYSSASAESVTPSTVEDVNALNATEVEEALAAVIKSASSSSKTASVTGDECSRAAEAQPTDCLTVSSLGPVDITEEHSYCSRQGIFAVKQLVYTCPFCPFKTRHQSAFRPHQLLHTGEKPYKCEVCGQGFRLRDTMRVHMRVHTGEQPYRCQVCDRTFTFSSSLRIHMRSHTGERPYRCEFCDKTLGTSYALKYHLRRHTGEKPYQCDSCTKAFPIASSLRAHKARHCCRQSIGVGKSDYHTGEERPDSVNERPVRDHGQGSPGPSRDDEIVPQCSSEFQE
ncbi:hypothetical protein HPB50_005001 [Hyalomma asiaticum]|uniref:Uncharacterized protein n=1 Tax=Hyalomma asiaticum TaxID=266040 RepID=A0ACB7RLN7_HYAAI|nr:hypothetical protein HPB50_005001 [Hyalomma asiaticum]